MRLFFRLWITLSSPPQVITSFIRHTHHSTNPKASHFLALLNLCRTSEDLKPLSSFLFAHGLTNHVSLFHHFFTSCLRLGASHLAISTFQQIKRPSLALQNLLIRCLCNAGLYQDVLCVYMRSRTCDDYTFPFVIKACAALRDVEFGKVVHGVVFRTGFVDNLVIQTSLVDFYAKTGCVEVARKVIDGISYPDLVPWNALIAGCSSNGFDPEALEVFREIALSDLKPNLSTMASIIPVCTRLGCADAGKSLHCFAVKSGFFSNDFLVPALISLYAGDADLCGARNLFDCVVDKNVAVWNAMISAYTQRQEPVFAFELFRWMLLVDVRPNLVTFVSIIPSLEYFVCDSLGESVHASVVKHGSETQLPVLTALVFMYAKHGCIDQSRYLFDQMSSKNILLWNSMISGYVYNGLWDLSLGVFREMQGARVDVDAVSVISILSACSKLEADLLGRSVHGFSIRKGIYSDLHLSNALLAFYSDCHRPSYSVKLFHQMPLRDAITWNTVISACMQHGELEEAASLYYQMQKEGFLLNLVTLTSILPCYNDEENIGQGTAVHGYAIKRGFASDISLLNSLISMYCNFGDLHAGRLIFETMPKRDVVSWNALMTSFKNQNLRNEVMALFSQMIKDGQRPNYVTLLNLLPACYTQLQGKSIHALAVRTGILHETMLLSSLMFMYARLNNHDSCFLLFQKRKKESISLWNAIMSVQIQVKNSENAVGFFKSLLLTELEPDSVTLLYLVSAYIQLNSLPLANSVMGYIIRKGFDRDLAISNALIDLHSKCGNICSARKLFDELVKRDYVSWSVMINGYGLNGNGEAALDLFLQMKLSRMPPNEITYLSVLSACSHSGLVEQGRAIFKSMAEHGIKPMMKHYACMVDLLGRTGNLAEAYDIVRGLHCTPSTSLLESLLGACRIHGNVEVGEEIARLLSELDPENSRPHVMLHNIYAAAGRWTDAARVRARIEEKCLRKVPGFSLLMGN